MEKINQITEKAKTLFLKNYWYLLSVFSFIIFLITVVSHTSLVANFSIGLILLSIFSFLITLLLGLGNSFKLNEKKWFSITKIFGVAAYYVLVFTSAILLSAGSSVISDIKTIYGIFISLTITTWFYLLGLGIALFFITVKNLNKIKDLFKSQNKEKVKEVQDTVDTKKSEQQLQETAKKDETSKTEVKQEVKPEVEPEPKKVEPPKPESSPVKEEKKVSSKDDDENW